MGGKPDIANRLDVRNEFFKNQNARTVSNNMGMSSEPLNRNLSLKCLPFNIRLALRPDEDGHLERWAMGY